MHTLFLGVGSDKIVMGTILLLVLFIGFFRLDTLIGAPRRRSGAQKPASGQDRQGRAFYSDPDGKPWK